MGLLACRFAALPILTLVSVLAHAQGTTPSDTSLLATSGPAGEASFAVNVRPGTSVTPFKPVTGTVTLFNGGVAIGSPVTLTPNTGFTSASFAQVFGTPDPSVAAVASRAVWGDFNEDGIPDLLVYGPLGQSLAVQSFAGNGFHPVRLTFPSFAPMAAQQLALPLLLQFGNS